MELSSSLKTYYKKHWYKMLNKAHFRFLFDFRHPPISTHRKSYEVVRSHTKAEGIVKVLQYYYCQLVYLDALWSSLLKGLPTMFAPLTKWWSCDDGPPSCFHYFHWFDGHAFSHVLSWNTIGWGLERYFPVSKILSVPSVECLSLSYQSRRIKLSVL